MESSDSVIVGSGSRHGTWLPVALQLANGILGKGLQLNGSAMLDMGNARQGCFMTPDLCHLGFTISFWVKDSVLNWVQFYLSSGGKQEDSVGVDVTRKEDGFIFIKTYQQMYEYQFNFPLGVWMQLAFSWHNDSSNPQQSLKLYINDTLVYPTHVILTDNSLIGNSVFNDIRIGGSNYEDSYKANCLLDEVLFWDREISADEVTYVYDTYASKCNLLRKVCVCSFVCVLFCVCGEGGMTGNEEVRLATTKIRIHPPSYTHTHR